MITHYPHDSDWQYLRDLTGDPSWAPGKMREIFERIEHCDYVKREAGNHAHHGFDGWLHTEVADLEIAVKDKQLLAIVSKIAPELTGPLTALRDRGGLNFQFFADLVKLALQANLAMLAAAANPLHALLNPLETLKQFLHVFLDPNDQRRAGQERAFLIPLSTKGGRRHSVRDRLVDTLQKHPDRLTLESRALVTKVLFRTGGSEPVAIGVEYLQGVSGAQLYQPDIRVAATPPVGTLKTVEVRREVILAGGAFNTPQLLMMSGVGPAAHLSKPRH